MPTGERSSRISPKAEITDEIIGRVLDADENTHSIRVSDDVFSAGDSASGQPSVTGAWIEIDSDENATSVVDAEMETESLLDIGFLVNWCARWSYPPYTDQIGMPPATTSAAYTRAKLYYADDLVNPIWSGFLDGDGCKAIGTESNTDYVFKVGSAVQRAGRSIYVQPPNAGCGAYYYLYSQSYHSGTVGPGQTYVLTYSSSSPNRRIAIIAKQAMIYYSSREWISSMTYIRPNAVPPNKDTSHWAPGDCSGTGRIYIDTYFENPDGPGTIDHSRYRFIVSHEMGHRQATATEGPTCVGCSGGVTSAVSQCRCDLFDSYKDGCFQSQSHIGTKQREAWANFYGAALYNDRNADECDWMYWRAMFENPLPLLADPDWVSPGPVYVDCSRNVKWMEEYCSASDHGTSEDWMAFYWNLWSNGTYRYSINQITNVWEETTPSSGWLGETWSELEDTVWEMWPSDYNKRQQFFNKGIAAGVNH